MSRRGRGFAVLAVVFVSLIGAASAQAAATFATPVAYGTPVYGTTTGATYTPQGVATGVFTSSGHTDIVAAGGSTFSFLKGNGDGTFQAAVSYPTGGTGADGIVVGDFNHDGKLDVAVVNSNAPPGDGSVSVFLGNGDGTFQPAATYSTGGLDPTSIAVGDFNGDSYTDLVVTNLLSGTVSVLVNDGSTAPGTFATAVPYLAGANPGSVAVGDFGSGHQDLAVASFLNPGSSSLPADMTVSILAGNGDGSFAAAKTISLGSGGALSSIAAADLNGDGKPDLVLVDYTGNAVLTMVNQGGGNFGAPYPSPNDYGAFPVGDSPWGVASADFDRDGWPDLAASNLGPNGSTNSPESLSVLSGNGDGTFGTVTNGTFGNVTNIPLGSTTALEPAIAAADFNGDGAPDLVVSVPSGVDVLLNTTPPGPPRVTISSPAANTNYALNANATASYGCSSAAGAPAVTSCSATVTPPGGTPTAVTNGQALPTSTAGQYTLTVTATDASSKQATKSVSYSVAAPEPASPEIDFTPNTSPFDNGALVTVSWSCPVRAGGLPITSCVASVVNDANPFAPTPLTNGQLLDTSQAGSYTVGATATDASGRAVHQEFSYTVLPARTLSVSITPPPGGTTFAAGQRVSLTYSCTDSGGQQYLQACLAPDNGAVDTSTPGTFTYTVTARDRDGQTASQSLTYTVLPRPVGTGGTPAANGTPSAAPSSLGPAVNPTTTSSTPGFASAATVNGNGVVSDAIICRGDQPCPVTETLTTTVTMKNGHVASASATRVKVVHRTVVVGSRTVTIAAGKTMTVTIALNGQGRSLLARLRKLPVDLAVGTIRNGKPVTVLQRRLTIKSPSRGHKKR